MVKEGAVVIGLLQPYRTDELVALLRDRKLTSFAMELVPRITRAQSMDVLSSMATVAGYKAVLLAAENLQKMGYTNVVSMDGGIRGWIEAGLPIEAGEP